jgi:hypothetical protein
MDFKRVLRFIVSEFSDSGVRYALIGGFAMGALGIVRATMDVDILVHRDDLPALERILSKRPYRCIYKTENVSQYVSDTEKFGQIDVLHAFRKISVSMLERARLLPVFENRFRIPVLTPEDIIGLKVQAMSNDPARQRLEIADIQRIMEQFGHDLDWELLQEYFQLFEKED